MANASRTNWSVITAYKILSVSKPSAGSKTTLTRQGKRWKCCTTCKKPYHDDDKTRADTRNNLTMTRWKKYVHVYNIMRRGTSLLT